MPILNNYQTLSKEISLLHRGYLKQYSLLVNNFPPQLLAVTKGQNSNNIKLLLDNGQRLFGENRVQEALEKWPQLKLLFPDIKLHMIGKLQTNKVKQAVELFDAIETIDNYKLASALHQEMQKQDKQLELFIQVNIGEEPQKSGINPKEVDEFIKTCQHDLGLRISGLMGIAPLSKPSFPYFALLKEIAKRNNIAQLSMGMSNDYSTAIQFGSTLLRIGSAIFT
jgi:pyridoxal phosphate enzyme (YggS family)